MSGSKRVEFGGEHAETPRQTMSSTETPAPGGAMLDYSLLADDRLRLVLEPELLPLIENWLPRIPLEPATGAAIEESGALIRIGCSGADAADRLPPTPAGEPTLRLGSATVWVDPVAERVELRGTDPRVRGQVDLARRHALLSPPNPDADVIVAANLYSMMTVVAALLLGRIGRTPIHAGAVVAPGGGALLLAGDARSGKSTTCINLITAGWDYLSDDQVVLSRAAGTGRVAAEGWPRTFHLDEGWERGVSTGVRRDFDPTRLGPGRWRRSAPIDGILFPIVRAEQPTALTPIPASDALARLIRQTPWLMVDPARGPALLALLSAVASTPAYELSLGLDTYKDPERLSRCIADR